jgi:hypothetical protein
MLNYAKSIEELLKAECSSRIAMCDFVFYYELARELKNDITDRFNSPALWAALDRLIEYIQERDKAYAEMAAAGYTADDAFVIHYHENTANL